MTSRSAEIPVSRDGALHARPAQLLVELANAFQSSLTLSRGSPGRVVGRSAGNGGKAAIGLLDQINQVFAANDNHALPSV